MKIRRVSQIFVLSLMALMGVLYVQTLGDPLQELYLTLAALGLISLSLILEQLCPLHREWNTSKGDTAGDVGSFILLFGVLDGALKWVSPFVILALIPEFGVGISMPLWLQIIVATCAIEFGSWLSHWAHHNFKPLWSLHAMHHSTVRLYTLNNFRFHPLNHILNYVVAFLPLLALGITPEALLGYTALALPVLLLQHSNVGFDFGILNYVFNTNTLHRWHHSTAHDEGMSNFGRALIIFDLVFGTFYYPSSTDEPKNVGLSQSEAVYPAANRTVLQILWPFSKKCRLQGCCGT